MWISWRAELRASLAAPWEALRHWEVWAGAVAMALSVEAVQLGWRRGGWSPLWVVAAILVLIGMVLLVRATVLHDLASPALWGTAALVAPQHGWWWIPVAVVGHLVIVTACSFARPTVAPTR